MVGLAGIYWPQIGQVPRFKFFFYLSVLAGAACVIAAAVLMAWYVATQSPRTGRRLAWGLFGLLCAELAINYVGPAYYGYGLNPPASRNPYNGAPYVDFIRQRNTDHARIFGRESLLYPNWSAAFALSDVRSLDALYDRRYMDFIRNFLLKPGDDRRHGDLADRFTGSEFPYDFDSELEKRFRAVLDQVPDLVERIRRADGRAQRDPGTASRQQYLGLRPWSRFASARTPGRPFAA